jgi:hypothetical protein
LAESGVPRLADRSIRDNDKPDSPATTGRDASRARKDLELVRFEGLEFERLFLSYQQWERRVTNPRPVLFALEGTNPAKNLFRSKAKILTRLKELAGFSS